MSSKIKLDNDYFIQVTKTGEISLKKDLHSIVIGKDEKEREAILTICYPSTILNAVKHYTTIVLAENEFSGNLKEYITAYENIITNLDREAINKGFGYKLNDKNKYDEISDNVISWAIDRNIISSDNVAKQLLKFFEEAGELSKAIIENNKNDIIDSIGDVLVTLEILVADLNLSKTISVGMIECYNTAYNEIKNRTGKTENGVFIKTIK